MKSTADVTQDTLTDCLTIHPLQPNLSPLARIDNNNLNSSSGASHESYSGMSKPWPFCIKMFDMKTRPLSKSLCNYVHIIGLSIRFRLWWTVLKCLSSLFLSCFAGTRLLQQSSPGSAALLTR